MSAESQFILSTPDGKKIYGIANQANAHPAKSAVVIAHGLTGHANEHQHLSAMRYFNALGYDVYRPNFYGRSADARKLCEETVQTQADDFNIVCDTLRPQYDKLFLIGHSYGGLAVLFANPTATAISFWDASFTPYEGFWKEEAQKLEGTPYYILGYGSYNLINPAMIEEAKNLTEADSIALAQRIQAPSQVVLAGLCSENPVRTSLYDALLCPKELVDIEGADHIFSKGQTVHSLIAKTACWFERY